MINPNDYGDLAPLVETGMHDSHAQASGGFVIVRFSDDTYDWFPIGAIPQRADGTIERRAAIVLRFYYNGLVWRLVNDFR